MRMRKFGTALAFLLTASASGWAETTILALGDSLTQGYGLYEEDGLTPQLQTWLRDHGAEAVVINAGVSGDTTAGGAARAAWSLTPDVDAMIVALGANDLLRGLDPEQARANLNQILTAGRDAGVEMLLIGFPAPQNYGADYKQAFDKVYPDLANSYGTLFVKDFFAPLRNGDDDVAALREWLQPDGLHPNAQGVARIVDGLGPVVLELIDRAGE